MKIGCKAYKLYRTRLSKHEKLRIKTPLLAHFVNQPRNHQNIYVSRITLSIANQGERD